jgi:hypothetical protein
MPSAPINISTSGDNINVIAVPGPNKFIRIMGFFYKAAGAVNVTFKDSTPTTYTGPMPEGTDTGFSTGPGFPQGWFDLGVNQALTINLSAGVQVSGLINYAIMGGP